MFNIQSPVAVASPAVAVASGLSDIRDSTLMNIPAPEQMGQGLYAGWRNVVERTNAFLPRGFIKGAGQPEVTLDITASSCSRLDLLGLGLWIDKLIRDLGIIPTETRCHEYGLTRSGDVAPGRLEIRVFAKPVARPPVKTDAVLTDGESTDALSSA